MGLENEQMNGLHSMDIINALKGHIKDGYKFNPTTPIKENSPHYRENPSLSDRMHCLVYVIPADKISMMEDQVFQKLKTIRDAAYEMDPDLPHVILMTRVDVVCSLTKKNLRYIYKSKIIKDKMLECQRALGVKMNAIFPVRNYHEETEINEDVNCLMLHALTRIVRWADDYVDKYSHKKKTSAKCLT
ncbi:interferon-induced protein 44-like [Astyanax mexicanus]|nr:interferon-induced protein 44-like [Astyanax mexicanus]